MRKFCCICLILITLIPTAVFASGDEFTVYIGDVHPFNYLNDEGVADGAAVEIVSEIMREAGNPIDIKKIKKISWPRAVDDAERISGTMVIGMAWTAQRNDKFKWVGPIGRIRLGLVAPKAANYTDISPDNLKKYRIGVIRNSASVHILEKQFGVEPSELHDLVEDGQMFKMLELGRVDLIAQADTAAPGAIREVGFDVADYEMVFTLLQLDLYAAFNKMTDDALIAKAQQALDAMKVSEDNIPCRFDLIMRRHQKDGVIDIR